MPEIDIPSELSRYSKLVEAAAERYIPRRIDEEGLKKILGEPAYRYEAESVNKGVLQPFWDLMDRGGKRWRPALTMMMYEALGGEAEEIAPLAVIPEAIHNGTLAVDDVEDESDFRRGKPCIHKIYGVDIAINMGNTMYFLPLLILNQLEISEGKKLAILEDYVRTMTELSIGQAMDIAWHRGMVEKIDEEQYLQMTLFKAGALARFATNIASILAGTNPEVRLRLERYAEVMAVGFQIQDDILNIVGEEEKYGKEIGGDIKEGKRTLMVIHALKNLPPAEAQRLREILNMRTNNPELIREAIELIKKAGSVEYARKVCRQHIERALKLLDESLEESHAKEKLKALTEFLIKREY